MLIPAAHAVRPGGEAAGIEIQPGMVRRLQSRAQMLGINNLT